MIQILPFLWTIRLLLLIVFVNGCLSFPLKAETGRSIQDLEKKITLSFDNISLKDALDKIAAEASVVIIYSNSKEFIHSSVSINVKNKPIKEVLNDLLTPFRLTYRVIDNKIVITRDGTKRKPLPPKQEHPTIIPIKGKVTDTSGQVLQGATIRIKGENSLLITNKNGEFAFDNIPPNSILQISFIGYKTKEITIGKDAGYLTITLEADHSQLGVVSIVSTGYQTIPKERATGSFTQIDNALINRSVSTNVLDRLNGVTSGLIFNNNGNHQFGQANIEIRGRATLFSNPDPLIVVDNFPYDGNLANINPNDIESMTVLKDAAAASAWGSRSGNGVIVITTKKGRLNAAPTVSFTVNTTVGEKPDLYYPPQLTSSQYIDVEQFLFNKGAYNSTINRGYAALSPVVQIFLDRRNGKISATDSLTKINNLKGYDSRQQISKYYYRPSVNQQYQASISGGSATQKYFVSAGYDKSLNSYVNSSYDRITLNASNTYYFLKNKLELFSDIIYTGSKTKSGPVIANTQFPYTQLADANGEPLAVANTLGIAYASTAGNGKLLNWTYKPLDELNNRYSTNTINLTDYRINLALNYKIFNSFKASALYSYEKGVSESNQLNELDSYYSRNLINTYSQINIATGAVTYPIPLGGILYNSLNNLQTHNGRFQLNYDHVWEKHAVSTIGGVEIKEYTSFTTTSALYGYDPQTATNQNAAVNYTALYPFFYRSSLTGKIPTGTSETGNTNRFFSYYFNGSYTYADKYVASFSARRDESNLFGVATNQKGIPLWSAGLAWITNKEDFYKADWLPLLKFRATYGYTGNVNNTISAYLTAIGGNDNELYNAYSSRIVNPPNPSLRWEKDRNINLGIDFSTKGNRLSGSLDYWVKSGIDLIGNSPIAPQTGVIIYTGNSANTLTRGVDIQLNSINLTGTFKWYTTLLYNFNKSKVTDYKVSNGTNINVISANYNNPLEGYPYYSIFSFKYAGLNSTGDPQGYLNGNISTDYSSMMSSTNRSELVFNGSATPASFGSVRNTFTYKQFDLSFNISYKFGYYFRRGSLDNGTLYGTGGNNYQMADYANRWQKTGDEQRTNVPALVYPSNTYRTAIYTYSNILVEKADHIRLQDIRLGYTFSKDSHLSLKNLNLFTYINNIGILWRANKYHIDPDYPTGIPAVRTIAFGVKADL